MDVAVVGAGPAGLAAAIGARRHGLSVAVLDEQGAPGGQIYRSIEAVARERPQRLEALGADYAAGAALVAAFRACGADYLPSTLVWRIDPDRTVFHSGPRGAGSYAAKTVVVATGALERPMPLPGWTLPGVLTCGGGQVLLKSADLAPTGRVYVAGSGPLLLLYAWQLLRAGVRVQAVLETTARSNWLLALGHLPQALRGYEYLAKGLRMLRDLRAANIPIVRNVGGLRALGKDRLEAIEFQHRGRPRREPADLLLLHQGVVPNVNLPFSMGCERIWDPLQRCFRPVVSATGETTLRDVYVAGDGAGIAGAKAAEHAGSWCAIAIAERLAALTAQAAARERRALERDRAPHLSVRPFLDALYRPSQAQVAPRDDATIACRCEEVTVGEIRALVRQGCIGPNQMKAFVRCGMGPCQGRLCGLTVVELIAEVRGVPVANVGYYRLRSPVKPITVGEIAGIAAVTDAAVPR